MMIVNALVVLRHVTCTHTYIMHKLYLQLCQLSILFCHDKAYTQPLSLLFFEWIHRQRKQKILIKPNFNFISPTIVSLFESCTYCFFLSLTLSPPLSLFLSHSVSNASYGHFNLKLSPYASCSIHWYLAIEPKANFVLTIYFM